MNWRRVASWVVVLCACSIPAVAQVQDYKNFKDPELFSRMPNYYLVGNTAFMEKEFDAHEFRVQQRGPGSTERVEGRVRHYHYTFDRTAAAPASALQIMRNYQAAAAKLGGTTLFDYQYRTTLRIAKDGKDIWVEVTANSGTMYDLWIVERQTMKQDVVGNAEAFQQGLVATGHVEVPGILFDTAKADIKPESDAALKEVVKLLQSNPTLRVWVVGHTDNVGTAQANVTLSTARADAVVKALVQMGIDTKRLAPHGAGPYAPVAANTTEEGRAKNRRVELVAQ